MVVKKKPGGLAALKVHPRAGRLSLRLHPHIKAGLEYLAREDQRTLSSYLDRLFIDHLRGELENHIESDGLMVGQPEARERRR